MKRHSAQKDLRPALASFPMAAGLLAQTAPKSGYPHARGRDRFAVLIEALAGQMPCPPIGVQRIGAQGRPAPQRLPRDKDHAWWQPCALPMIFAFARRSCLP